MISSNNLDLTACEPFLEKKKKKSSDLSDALTSYRTVVDAKDIAGQELYQLRDRYERKKSRIETLERDVMLERDARTVAKNKNNSLLYISQREVIVKDNVRLNSTIVSWHVSLTQIEKCEHATKNFLYP